MKTKEITGKTKICGVIGDPIEHTLSPVLHNAAYEVLNLDYVYLPFSVKPAALRQAVDGMRGLNIRGLNVTIPHKQAVIPLLDAVDDFAAKIGAVNTIVNENGRLTGYNTDAPGFLQPLMEHGINPAGKKVLLLGAGGAARAIAFVLAASQADITILNRKQEIGWAYDIIQNISPHYPANIEAAELNSDNLRKYLPDVEILVNATSVGMTPANAASPVPADLLCAKQVVFDIVYNPLPTRLLRESRAAGAVTIDGLEMLVWQGALAFEKFTGVHPPTDIMRQAALKVITK